MPRTKNSYLSAKYYKLRARRGPQRALMAIAHKILVAAYWILRTGQCYLELGGEYLDRLHVDRRRASLVRALESLGYAVPLEPKELPTGLLEDYWSQPEGEQSAISCQALQ